MDFMEFLDPADVFSFGQDKKIAAANKALNQVLEKGQETSNQNRSLYNQYLNKVQETDFALINTHLDDFEGFLDWRYFRVGFSLASEDIDDREEIESHGYNIEYYDDGGIVKFWEENGEGNDADDGIHGEGDKIVANFNSANILNNDVVVTIPIENVPQDADNEFTVVILQEDDDPKEIPLKLDEILEGDNYILRVSDFDLPEFKENYFLFMFLQFYREGEKAYYAEYWDDEYGIHIFESPCIFTSTSIFLNDDIISIQEIPEGVDEFTITISKEGSEDIVKTFKFSEIEIGEATEEVWVAFKFNELGITEEGNYSITTIFKKITKSV